MGAEVETYIGDETGGAYLSALSSDFDQALAILAEVLAAPRFDQDKIDLAKKEQTAGIARRNDDPMTIARREFARVIYGADHPLGRLTEYATINAHQPRRSGEVPSRSRRSRPHLPGGHRRFPAGRR